MAVTPAAAQPPKPPPPPKTDAAAGADKKAAAPKPAEASRPTPLRTPDVFEQASGGGRPQPSSGGSSFTPAMNNTFSALNSAQQRVEALRGNAPATQSGMAEARREMSQELADFRSEMTENVADFRADAMEGLGELRGETPVLKDSFASPSGPPISLQDLMNWNVGGGPGLSGHLDSAGGGSKPGIGAGNGGAFLRSMGSGASPTTTNPSTISVPTRDDARISFDTRGNDDHSWHHRRFSFFDFGRWNGGGGGAAGGVADRWNR